MSYLSNPEILRHLEPDHTQLSSLLYSFTKTYPEFPSISWQTTKLTSSIQKLVSLIDERSHEGEMTVNSLCRYIYCLGFLGFHDKATLNKYITFLKFRKHDFVGEEITWLFDSKTFFLFDVYTV